MTVNGQTAIDISSESGRALAARARAGRKRALSAIAQYCVVITEDGQATREVLFSQPPTMDELSRQVSPGAFVVSVRMNRRYGDAARRILAAE